MEKLNIDTKTLIQIIKLIVFDIDGTLTDGKIYMANHGELFKAFDVKDGYALSILLPEKKIVPVVLTSRYSKIVENRCRELGVSRCYQGVRNKAEKIKELADEFGLRINEKGFYPEIAYMGDDLIDLPAMKICGIVGCPADAVEEVKAIVDYICLKKAGEGAVREFVEWLNSEKSLDVITGRVNDAVRYIQDLSNKKFIPGSYFINNFFSYNILKYKTKKFYECRLESHRNYIEIQLLLEGTEMISVADISRLQKIEYFIDGIDVMYWKPPRNMMQIVLQPQSLVVLFPRDAHMCCIAVDEPMEVTKLVGKIKLN